MTWEERSPFAAAAGAVGSFLTSQQRAKKDAAEAARQADLDRAAAVTGSLANEKTRAEITGLGNTAAHQHAEDVSHGYVMPPGAIPPEMPTAQPGKPPPSNRDWANYYSKYAAFYTKNKALDAASTAVGLAEKYGNLAKGEEAAALALRKEANTEIETQARIHHWTAQEEEEAKKTAAQLTIAAGHDATSVQNTQAHVAAMISAANIAADSRLKLAKIGASGALLRERETQRGENTRHQNTEDNLNRRFNVRLRHEDAKPPKPPGFRGIDPTTAMNITKHLDEALAAGMDRTKIFAEEARLHGVSPVEIEGIYKDYSKNPVP
jgi:hypothetical protein